jgi:hypothetical protein
MASDTLVWAIYTWTWAMLGGGLSRHQHGQSLLTDSFGGTPYN